MMRMLLAAALISAAGAAKAAPRVVSLDPCADQYVLALSPRATIAGLSYRSEAGDSYLAVQAHGLPKRRDSLESLLAVRPDLVLRYWGGDARLVRALTARGIRVVDLDDARDFDGVRANVRRAAAALDNRSGGEALIADMDRKLNRAGAAPSGRRATYMTPGGATAGPGVLTDAILSAAGLRNAEIRPGYRELSLERLALHPPEGLVLGFFDAFSLVRTWWSPARSGVMRRITRTRMIASLPGAVLACPAWFAADGALMLFQAARR